MIGTPLEAIATEIRWHLKALHRYRFPEMREAELEENRLPDVLRKLLSSDAHCLDVVGHIGGFTSLLFKMFPNGKHMTIEASPTKALWINKSFPNADFALSRSPTSRAKLYSRTMRNNRLQPPFE